MDVVTIARRVQLPLRRVRYAADHGLAGTRGRPQSHLAGRPRSFTEMEAYLIACAALLMEAGLARRAVAGILTRLADMPWPLSTSSGQPTAKQRAIASPKTAIEALYFWSVEPTSVSIADGTHLRIKTGSIDTGWVEPRTLAVLRQDYQPRALVQLDLSRLRAQMLGDTPKPSSSIASRARRIVTREAGVVGLTLDGN